MKIIQIVNCTPPNQVGGAEISAQEVRRGLQASGAQVDVLTLRTNLTVKPNSTEVHEVRLRNLYDPWRDTGNHTKFAKIAWKILDGFNPISFIDVYRKLRTARPDVILSHNLKGFSTSAWAAARALRIPIVHVIHDYYLICSTCALGVPGTKRCVKQCLGCELYTFPSRITARSVSRFVGVSDFVAKKHSESLKIPMSKFSTISNVRSNLRPTQISPLSSRSSPLRIGFIGRLEPAKGIDDFLSVASKLGGRFKWVVAGEAPNAAYLEQIKARWPSAQIAWLGRVSPSTFYEQVDCVIVPSLWDEPYPAVAYEPQIFGRVVLASRVGGIPEMIDDGVTGFLFEPGALEQIEEILCRLDANRNIFTEVASQAYRWSSRFTNAEAVVAAYVDIIHQAIGSIGTRHATP